MASIALNFGNFEHKINKPDGHQISLNVMSKLCPIPRQESNPGMLSWVWSGKEMPICQVGSIAWDNRAK